MALVYFENMGVDISITRLIAIRGFGYIFYPIFSQVILKN